MDARDEPAREIQAAIAKILLEDWDPIGVHDVTEAQDEYDSYVSGVYRLLVAGATAEALAAHLLAIENEAVGLALRGQTDLAGVAQKLRNLDVRLASPQEKHMNPRLERIIAFLNAEHWRATYGAVGEALGLPPQTVGGMLGERRPVVSWIVSAQTLEPTGYEAADKHAALHEHPEAITTGAELLRRMNGLLESDDAR
jgi:hypothetical protein